MSAQLEATRQKLLALLDDYSEGRTKISASDLRDALAALDAADVAASRATMGLIARGATNGTKAKKNRGDAHDHSKLGASARLGYDEGRRGNRPQEERTT